MIEINPIHLMSAACIGLGLVLNLLGLFEALKPQIRRVETPVFPQGKVSAPAEVRDIEAEFETFSHAEPTVEHREFYEIPDENIRPGDLLETAKIPALIQTFKFRGKGAPQNDVPA